MRVLPDQSDVVQQCGDSGGIHPAATSSPFFLLLLRSYIRFFFSLASSSIRIKSYDDGLFKIKLCWAAGASTAMANVDHAGPHQQ